MVNKKQQKREHEGYYLVMNGRALHWPTRDGKPRIWARAGQCVDLRSRFLCEIVQQTGQLHKLVRVEKVPADTDCVTTEDIPPEVRDRLRAYEAREGVTTKVGDSISRAEAGRSIDVDQLPSAAAPKEEPVKEAPKPKPTKKEAASDE